MNTDDSNWGANGRRKLIDIESTDRLTSDSIGALSDQPDLLKAYLDSALGNTFSELMFRLTHEVYAEEKASELWHQIATHRAGLKKRLDRDVGTLVAALDYLSNISGDISSPKIMADLRIEEAAAMATRDSLTGLSPNGVRSCNIASRPTKLRACPAPFDSNSLAVCITSPLAGIGARISMPMTPTV